MKLHHVTNELHTKLQTFTDELPTIIRELPNNYVQDLFLTKFLFPFHHQQLEDPTKTQRIETTEPVPLFLFAQNRTPFTRPKVVIKILVKIQTKKKSLASGKILV
jgi:hypothetical protein